MREILANTEWMDKRLSESLVYMHDPAHGWLRVPLAMIEGETYSDYSYFNTKFAYLEEDSDMTKFLENHVEVDTELVGTQYFPSREAFLAEVRRW
jgi:hypothetical protein